MLSRKTTTLLCLTALSMATSAHAATRCDKILAQFGDQLADATCVESTDLTTANASTTPANNFVTTLPAFAITPQTDRATIAPSAANKTPIVKAVPGVQIDARIASDPTGQARFLLRLPDDWNGRLVVAGASGTRSEFNGDFAWSDYVVQKGYAYASQNKGVLNFQLTTAADPLGCRLQPESTTYVHFYDDDPNQPFTRWRAYMTRAAELARIGLRAAYNAHPRFTYAVGTSNGGYQVRRAVETAPDLFDGGVDWEGTFVDPHAPNLLTDLPAAVLNFPDYLKSGCDPNSTAAKNMRAAGYPPDILKGACPASITAAAGGNSLWGNYAASFWEVTQCQWQKRLDPGYDTYGSGTGTYNYVERLAFTDVGEQMRAFATTGHIKRPLVTVAGTMDGLLPIEHHARAYARKVAAAAHHRGHDERDDGDRKAPEYRLYEVQNGNHIETYRDLFPRLELLEPHAQHAFDLLVQHVENRAPLPPDQCIPHGGAIAASPGQPGHCASLFVP